MVHDHAAIAVAAQNAKRGRGKMAKGKGGMLRFGSVPLLLIPVIIYNIMAFIYMGGDDRVDTPPPPAPTQELNEATPQDIQDAAGDAGAQEPLDEPVQEQAEPAPVQQANAAEQFLKPRFTIPLPTGGRWAVSSGDILLMLSLGLLFLELIRSTSASTSAIVNHALSLILFVGCLIEFLLIPAFATSIFFLIMLMTLLDVLAGFIVTIVAARRDIAVGNGFE